MIIHRYIIVLSRHGVTVYVMEVSMKVIDIAYPGQSDAVRVGLGVTAIVVYDDGAVRCRSLTWEDRPYPLATLPWEEFARKYSGHPIVDREDRLRKERLGLK